MKLWPVALFFHSLLESGTYKTLQYAISCTTAAKEWHAAMFYMFADSKSEFKKWATSQSFIRKEITTYRIGTLNKTKTIFFIFLPLFLHTIVQPYEKPSIFHWNFNWYAIPSLVERCLEGQTFVLWSYVSTTERRKESRWSWLHLNIYKTTKNES